MCTPEREIVFRDPDWGMGMFDETAPWACVTATGEVWLMVGLKAVEITEEACMKPDEARAIAAILYAAADEADKIKRKDCNDG